MLIEEDVNIFEFVFANFIIYESDIGIHEFFNSAFPPGSDLRKAFTEKFKSQTEKVISKAQNKTVSPIYLSSEMCSRYEEEREKEVSVKLDKLPAKNKYLRPASEIDLAPKKPLLRKVTSFDR